MRAEVIIPRSPTITTSSSPKRSRTASASEMNAVGPPVLPAKTSTATGRPSGQQVRPYSIWALSAFPVAGVAPLGERAVAPLHPGATEVVEHPAPAAQVAPGQGSFDVALAGEEPVHGGVDLVGRDLQEARSRP